MRWRRRRGEGGSGATECRSPFMSDAGAGGKEEKAGRRGEEGLSQRR